MGSKCFMGLKYNVVNNKFSINKLYESLNGDVTKVS